ncbi:hypothetical protein LF65_01673 [Clostridium beijerinckii]|uniref:Beta-galactosidase n=1 Tax=Clostridium beijerinckii TaxID=1520 RepID=A0A0B5QK40_CLOBE|nr:beta-galactosidase [Clostridium beijerinckii]AJG98277.1 hypothetical protein LF65_01673 [Clostridium beijerinckii]
MYFGADYYPEHWPRAEWESNALLMKEASINVVRIAEFAWAKMEPKEGVFDFSWLDEVIEVLSKQGIKVILGTPTATPPKWLSDKIEDIYMVNEFNQVRGFGSRRHYCYNNSKYKEYTAKIVTALAKHYKNNTNVVAWQIDNEFGCHDTVRCYCNNCLKDFQGWLENKYKSIERLNEEWGTVFWSQTYSSFEEIILPKYTVCDSAVSASGLNGRKRYSHNPGLLLDFYRFSSDSVVKYQKLQIDIIKNCDCNQPINNNLMGHFNQIDYFKLGEDLDFVSWDNYPNNEWGQNSMFSVSMAHDLMRGVKGKKFWMMEQQSGPCGWNSLGDTPKPGQIRLWTYQAIAHGAEGIVFFRWRACPFGTEQYWYGILDHDGIPRRRYKEIKQIGSEVERLSDLFVDSKVLSEAAIIKSYDNLWSHQFQPHNEKFDYNSLLIQYYTALGTNNINSDIVPYNIDFSEYKLLIMPAFNLMKDDILQRVENYVSGGGNLVLTFRSGTKEWNNSMTIKTLPGYFKELAGVTVEEFDSINFGREVQMFTEYGMGKVLMWADILKPISAEIIGTYASDFYEGEAAITVNSYGKGKVYYIGCDLEQEVLNKLLEEIALKSGIKPLIPNNIEGVEVVSKEKNGRKYIIVMNHNGYEVEIHLSGTYKELISNIDIDGKLMLNPYEVAILETNVG